MGSTKFSTSTALALAAVLLSSSTTVFAVAALPRHSVGAKQLKTFSVTNSKIAKYAVTSSKVKPNSLGGSQINESSLGQVPTSANAAHLAQRIAFGKGNATAVPATTVLSLRTVGVTVTTDSDVDLDPVVEVNLPMLSGGSPQWYVNSSDQMMYSTYGGTREFGAAAGSRDFTANIWRNDSTQAIFLHCTFDTTGFSTVRPLSCWAFST